MNRPAPKAAAATALLAALLLPLTAAADCITFEPQIQLTQIASGLASPITVRHAGDGSGRLFIVQQGGQILVYENGSVLPTPFLDIDPRVTSGGERGLLGLAFDPDYESNGFFYVHYTATNPLGDNVISRFSVSAGDPNVADDTTEQILLTIDQPQANHNGGDLHFGPDGFLYASVGDGGGSGDTGNNAQNINNLLGTLLRLEADGDPAPTNPFVGAPGEDEIWAYGLRNPWRFSFDRETGDLFIGDVGQGEWEEVDFQPASSTGGENYGWRCYEGNNPFNTSGCLPPANYVFPIAEYNHGLGSAITGGFRYRGPGSAPYGWYLYSDSGSGRIFGAFEDVNESWNACELTNTPQAIVSFGEDEAGNLYVVNIFGTVSRVDGSGVFGDAFETGFGRWTAVIGSSLDPDEAARLPLPAVPKPEGAGKR